MRYSLFRPGILVAASVGLLVLLISLLVWHPGLSRSNTKRPLVMYCAAGVKAPIEAIARQYEQMSGVPIHVQYGGSQTLLAGLEISKRGDLYLPADDSYLKVAREKKLVAETILLARMNLVLAVKKGNPKRLLTLGDLTRPDVRLAQGDPEATAIGHVGREVLRAGGQWNAIQQHTAVFKLTVNDVANDLKIGSVDAGLLWDAVVEQYPELEMIRLPAFTNAQGTISVGVLRSCRQPTAALRFTRFLGAPEYGVNTFARHHYETFPGDAWTETPELVLYSGAVNRVAVEESIQKFAQREGVKVSTIFNGCGILVAQMKTGARPDAYLTCDASFVPPVADLFLPPPVALSKTDIVILVPKGNPRNIRGLADLAKEGLRVGLANPEQSTLGALTRRLLEGAGIHAPVMRNVVTQTPTADLLVNQIRTGALDAVVVYTANTTKVRDSFELIPLPMPGAVATQTYSVGANSKHRRLAERLLQTLKTDESRARYEAAGFQWQE